MSAFEKITAQQQGKEHTPVWMVGQQLKDMLQDDPTLEEILDKDLDVKGMALADCAAKIKAFADEYHRKIKGNCIWKASSGNSTVCPASVRCRILHRSLSGRRKRHWISATFCEVTHGQGTDPAATAEPPHAGPA